MIETGPAKPAKTSYVCSICLMPADVVDGRVVRTCEHEDAAVLAMLEAKVFGKGAAQ